MRINVYNDSLLAGLLKVKEATTKNASMPVLEYVLIEAKDNKIVLKCTNLETFVSTSINGGIDEEGSCTIQVSHLLSYIQTINIQTSISIVVEKNSIALKWGKEKAKFIGKPVEDFPAVDTDEEKKVEVKLPASSIDKMLSKVAGCVARNSGTRPELTGVYFLFDNTLDSNSVLRMVSTDSYRLADTKLSLGVKIEDKESGEFGFILPSNSVNILKGILKTAESTEIVCRDTRVEFIVGDTIMISRIIEGVYPNFRAIIRDTSKYKVAVEREELLNIIKRVAIFSSDKTQEVMLTLQTVPDITNPENASEQLIARAESNEVGDTETSIKISSNIPLGSEGVKIKLNYKYLLDGINHTDNSEDDTNIIMGIESGDKPLIISNKNYNDYLYVIMPLK